GQPPCAGGPARDSPRPWRSRRPPARTNPRCEHTCPRRGSPPGHRRAQRPPRPAPPPRVPPRGWHAPAPPPDPRSAQPCQSRLAPSLGAFAAIGEIVLVADGASLQVAHLDHPGGQQALVGDRAKVDQAARAVGISEGRVDLLADLIATGTRAGTHDRPRLASAANLAQSTHALLQDPGGKPAPAGVQSRHGAVGAEHHRDAVGGEDHRRDTLRRHRVTVRLEAWPALAVGPKRAATDGARVILWPQPPGWAWAPTRVEDAPDDGPMHLVAADEMVHAELRAQALARAQAVGGAGAAHAGKVALGA